MQALRGTSPQTALRSAGLYVSLAHKRHFDHITRRLESTTSDLADIRRERGPEYDDSDPVRLFKIHLEGGTLTKESALSHLKALTQTTRYDTGLGEATIDWMWNEYDKYDDSKVDRDLLEHTIRHLVSEGKEELAWNWIEQGSREPYFVYPENRFIWRSAAVRALVSTKAFSADYDSLDGALETYFRAESSSYSIPLAPARTTLATLLMMPREKMVMDSTDVDIEVLRWPNTSTELWETFLESTNDQLHSDEPLYTQLPLYHPQVPDAFPFLEHCQLVAGLKSYVRSMVKWPSVIPWIRRGLHAEAVLRRQGHEQHADWLKQFIRELHKKPRPISKKEEKLRGTDNWEST